ncbi:MAG TPA: S-adenosylmethionine:tRNA ribosyltransferase-isomerase, partial [Acidimicrobiales bacterium]|nr:S-adenosylmethionine:tRNA ribosyltransferase-isomerase [Acidimicrobiales bacterium]
MSGAATSLRQRAAGPSRPGFAAADLASFELPASLEASEPPEARGLARDDVRMLVAHRGSGELVHARFRDLACFLDEGDLVVINTSGTLAAAIPAVGPRGEPFEVHLSTELPAGLWTVELRRGPSAWLGASQGEVLRLPDGGKVTLLGPYARAGGDVRLWVALLELPAPLSPYLSLHGKPIRYGYVHADWPLEAYQNV